MWVTMEWIDLDIDVISVLKVEQREIADRGVDACLGMGERVIPLYYGTKQIPFFHTKAPVCFLAQISGISCPASHSQ